MPSLDPPKTLGLLSMTPNGPRSSTTFDIGSSQSWLHALTEASGQHKVTRWQGEGSPVTVSIEGGSTLSITPAGSEEEFFAQRDSLTRAFEVAYGRAPSGDTRNPADLGFWQVLAAIFEAYEGPTLDADAVLGGLS